MTATVELYVKRIANFLERNPSVDMEEFFDAPYKVYPDGEYFDLKFFTSPKAVSVYKMNKNSKKPLTDGKGVV